MKVRQDTGLAISCLRVVGRFPCRRVPATSCRLEAVGEIAAGPGEIRGKERFPHRHQQRSGPRASRLLLHFLCLCGVSNCLYYFFGGFLYNYDCSIMDHAMLFRVPFHTVFQRSRGSARCRTQHGRQSTVMKLRGREDCGFDVL